MNWRIFYVVFGHIILLTGPVTAIIALALQLRACRRSLNDLSARYTKRGTEILDLQGILRTMREQRRSRSLPRAKPKST